MKIKLFSRTSKHSKVEGTSTEFEAEIGTWLQNHPTIQIRQVQQSAGAGSMGPFLFFVTILYDEAN